MLRRVGGKRKQKLWDRGSQWRRYKKGLILGGALLVCVLLLVYVLQHCWAHRSGQKYFMQSNHVCCTPLLGWFTREDRLMGDGLGPDFADLQPGDIILTLSTHSLGWRHGHAALVIDENTTLECAVLGMESGYGDPRDWRTYSGYCVLRIKGVTPEMQQEVAEYAREVLHGVPYHLSAGFIGAKAPESDSAFFGLHCSYLVWYAWNHFGYDLDADGGRLVTATDILESELLEVVQVYGMNVP